MDQFCPQHPPACSTIFIGLESNGRAGERCCIAVTLQSGLVGFVVFKMILVKGQCNYQVEFRCRLMLVHDMMFAHSYSAPHGKGNFMRNSSECADDKVFDAQSLKDGRFITTVGVS
jgi:hypothetical protein